MEGSILAQWLEYANTFLTLELWEWVQLPNLRDQIANHHVCVANCSHCKSSHVYISGWFFLSPYISWLYQGIPFYSLGECGLEGL